MHSFQENDEMFNDVSEIPEEGEIDDEELSLEETDYYRHNMSRRTRILFRLVEKEFTQRKIEKKKKRKKKKKKKKRRKRKM